jgi:integrase
MVAALPPGVIGIRDKALLLVGFAGALRRSELVALTVADLDFTPEGLVVALRRSKTDQEGKGRKIGIPPGRARTCPVRALQDWLEAAGIGEGAVFRGVNRHGQVADKPLTGRSVARIIQRAAERAGLDSTRFAGHSLRAGLVTTAAKAGKPTHSIMAQTGHKSVGMVQKYIREAKLFEENAAAGIGL